jgi:hypothetical protein
MANYKRKKKLINSTLQLKLVGSFLAVACLASLFQVLILNNSMMGIVSRNSGAGDELLASLPGIMARNVLLTLGVLAPLMFTVGVLITHRVAGPAYRMETYLRQIAREGRVASRCRIRKGDELRGLCDALNDALAALTGPLIESAEAPASELDEPASLAREATHEHAEEQAPVDADT